MVHTTGISTNAAYFQVATVYGVNILKPRLKLLQIGLQNKVLPPNSLNYNVGTNQKKNTL